MERSHRKSPFFNPQNSSVINHTLDKEEIPQSDDQESARSLRYNECSASESSNVKENWTPYVQKQGDLFYVQVSDQSGTSREDNSYMPEYAVPVKRNPSSKTPTFDRHRTSHQTDAQQIRLGHDSRNVAFLVDNGSESYQDKIRQNKYSHNSYGNSKEDHNISRSSGYSESSSPLNERCNGDINHNSINRNVNNSYHAYDSDFYDKHSDVSVDRSSVDSSPAKPVKIKHVYITPNSYSCRNGENLTGIALCDKLFGITLYHYNHRQSRNSGEMTYKERKLLVQHVSMSSPAGRSQQIHRGDMMVAVNDVPVNWENLEPVCNNLSSKVVKLSFQLPNVVGPKPSPPPPVNPQFAMTSPRPVVNTPSPRPPRHRKAGENLSQLVFGDSHSYHLDYLQETSCCVMYLTLEGDGSSDTESVREDIVYQYPPGDSKLLEVRGLFLTLCGVLPEVASSSARSSTIVHQRQKIHIAYQRDGKDVLVIGLPADKVPKSCVEEVLQQLNHLILVLYGPLNSAFRDMKHRSQLDQLFSLSLHNIHSITQSAMISSQSSKIFTEIIPGPKALNFTDDTKLLCDEILSEFEASDFDDLLDPLSKDSRREYSILGSCVFYKEYLLCNHLSQSDLNDVHLFLKHHCIVKMLARKSVEELVVWREMFPSQYSNQSQPCPQGYQHPNGRWYLMVVGMKHFLLCTLLEAGGCSKSQTGNPSPHPFYVSQAKATLLQFEADEVTMTQSVEHRLSKISKGPCLACADSVIVGQKQKKDEVIVTPQKSRLSSRSSYDDHDLRNGGSGNSTPVMKRQGSKLSYGSNDSGESSGSLGVNNKNRVGLTKAGSIFDITNSPSSYPVQGDEISHIKLTKGIEGYLFHYICMNEFEGTYISPTQQEMSVVNGALQEVVMNHFYTTCLQIRSFFRKSLHKSKCSSQASKFGEDTSFNDVREQGVLFTCSIPQHSENSKKQPSPLVLTYWVVGRVFPNNKELYVCFHESIPQTAIEMAFKLDNGLLLT